MSTKVCSERSERGTPNPGMTVLEEQEASPGTLIWGLRGHRGRGDNRAQMESVMEDWGAQKGIGLCSCKQRGAKEGY